MVWSMICPADGKPRFILKRGNYFMLTKDRRKANADRIPEGFVVEEHASGNLRLHKRN